MDGSTAREPAPGGEPEGIEPPASRERLAARDAAAPDASMVETRHDEAPIAGPALDMRLQWNTVHARLFGRPPEEHRIGRYIVSGTLGQGGMGKVLRAHDETLGRDVALKVLHESLGRRYEQRLRREAQALARLSHPNIVRVYDVAEIDGRVCMAMELVEGTPLQQWQRQPRPWTEVLAAYLQAGRGLAAAHAEGLVHRDFKPANCIVDAHGVVKVLDFGLARGMGGNSGPHPAAELDPTADGERSGSGVEEQPSFVLRSQRVLEQALTRTGTLLGTLAYMAPEQLMGKPAEPRSDQFAFCVALYEGLYGVRPFPGKSGFAILHAIHSRQVDPRPAAAGLPPVPRWLHEIVRRGLSVASHQRWPDMKTLLGALERGVARRRRIRGAALGVALLVGLGGVLTASGAFQGERPCEGLREQGMPAWADADRAAVGAALEAAGLPEGSRGSVEASLDAYAAAWAVSRADACEATWVRREAGEQVLVRRMACLDERAGHMRAVVQQLASADDHSAAFAGEAVEQLPELYTCEDVEGLLRGPEPVPAAQADAAAAVRALVARSWALGATGDGEHGLEAADRAVVEAEALADAPTLRLEALHNRGHLLRMARRWEDARHELEEALELAERLEDSSRAIDVLIELIRLADEQRDVSAADAWLGALRGKLGRFEEQPHRVAQRWWVEGLVAQRAGRNEAALAAAERAVQAYEELEPPVHGEHIEALLLLGDAHRDLRDLDGAREVVERARVLAEAEWRLPLVAEALYRQGYFHFVQGEADAARPLLERALSLRDAFYGPGAIASIRTRNLLAQVLLDFGDDALAMQHVTRARRSADEGAPAQIRGEVLELIAVLHRRAKRWDDAIASYREARDAWKASPDRAQLAMIDSNIADCRAAQGEHRAARVLYDDAIALLDAVALDDPRRIYPLFGRGRVSLELGDRAAAVADLRAAEALHRERSADPFLGAEVRWALATALAGDPEDGTIGPREAGRLAHDARTAFAEIGVDDRVEEIDAWLERCGAPCSSTK